MPESEKEKLLRRLARIGDQRLLERMRANGFWPAAEGLPPDPPAEAEERARLDAEAGSLQELQQAVADAEAALGQERERRQQESRERRAEQRARRLAAQEQRRREWEALRQGELVHAGGGVSAGLGPEPSDVVELQRRGLPVLHSSQELAAALGISISRLRWLTFHRRGATLVHYHRFEVPKKAGGMRSISAPKQALAAAQQWVLAQVLQPLAVEPQAHGFVPERSIVTNATPHLGQAVVANLDMKDFFPSIGFRRVKGLFRALGYGEHVATVLALLCTEPPRVAATVDGQRYQVAIGERCLPQGACTSPAITNAICRGLDRRLAGLAARAGFAYTRYADDLTFSGPQPGGIGALLRKVRKVLADEGLAEHPDKTRVMRQGRRQEVTGVTVNHKLSVDRRYWRELRAILHNAARSGLESQNREGHPHFAAYLRGRVEFVCMVDPSRREALQAALARALGR